MGTRARLSLRNWHAHLLAFCALTLSLADPAVAQQKKLKLLPTETSFGKLPPGARGDQLFFSPDGRHVAAVVKRPDGAAIWIDGVEGKLQEWILPSSPVWSPDGGRLAYNVQRGENLLVVVGTEEQKPYADVSHVTFSPDGKRLAYTAKLTANSSGVSIVLDGVEGTAYPTITPRSLSFSPDGKRFAYRVETGTKQFWVIDGKELPQHDRVGPITFSKDGTRFGYSAADGNAHRIVTERPNWPSKSYDAAGGLNFSADGKRLAYAARRGNHEFVVIDDVEGKEYDRVAEPLFNATGARVAYEAVRDKLAMVVIDGKEQAGFDAVSEARFSNDGNHVGYRAVRGDGKLRLVIDGKESEPYDRIHAWLVNDDATRIAFSARVGEEDFLVLDGKRLPGPGHLTMSPDGKYVAHSRVSPADKTTVLMVNETDGPAYDGFLAGSRWVFHAPNKLACMAARKGEILRVEVEIAGE
jgi:WD40 repeat protein